MVRFLQRDERRPGNGKGSGGSRPKRKENAEGSIELTWGWVYKQAFGILSLKPTEFWDLSWPEFWHLYQGWQIRRQYEFEHTRAIMAAISNAAFGQKKAVKPQKIMRLPEIDGGTERLTPTQDFIKRMSEREIAAGRLKPGQLIQLAPPTQE